MGNLERIEGLKLGGEAGHVFGLVGLQAADDGPFQPGVIGIHEFRFRECILHLVFAEKPVASPIRLIDHAGRLGFGDW